MGLYVLAAVIGIVCLVGLYYAVTFGNSPADSFTPDTQNKGGKVINCSAIYDKYTAGVVTNGVECAEIGTWVNNKSHFSFSTFATCACRNILKKGGSVADTAIAALFCEGIAQPQSMGLGGGFLLTMYTRSDGKVRTLDARETAPAAATVDMFNGNASLASTGKNVETRAAIFYGILVRLPKHALFLRHSIFVHCIKCSLF